MIQWDSVEHVHLLGICGTAMGAFAGMLHELGYRVTGSDSHPYPPMSTQLASLGIKVYAGYSTANLDDGPDLVIIGNVIRRENPEAQAVVAAGLPYLSLPAAISERFLKGNHPIVVAGTHGKTTTAAICAWCLYHAGYDPGFLIGGELRNLGKNYRCGKQGYFVIEGDEYDTAFFDKGPKFLHYRPQSAIITSVEFDHADIYRNLEHVKAAFRQFVQRIPPDGLLAACSDYEHVMSLVQFSRTPPHTYGLKCECEYSGYIEETGPDGMRFVVTQGGAPTGNFNTKLVGKHNLLNLIAVTIILSRLGLSPEQIASGFASFDGVRRRQEVFAEVAGITLVDDFAHHPTAVQVTIDAIRMRFPDRRLWAVFEPRSATSRRNVFQDRFAGAFVGANQVIIADVYHPEQVPEEERFSPQLLAEALQGRGVDARALPSTDDIIDKLVREAVEGDVILIMSNGGFDGIYERLPAALAAAKRVPWPPSRR